MQKLTHLSLFTGVGGLDLAAERAGFSTVGQCEWADYPRDVLARHWPNVPRWRDIRTLTKEDFFEQTGLQTITVLSGGFPCQPFSQANSGNRRGRDDDRFLWPEMLRVASELRPAWIVGENVNGIINLALDQVLADMENAGYAARAFVVPAVAVNAPHRRDRVAIVGCRKDHNDTGSDESSLAHALNRWTSWWLEHPEKAGEAPRRGCYNAAGIFRVEPAQWWGSEPGVGRVAYGIPHRVDRLKCLGNAVVPYQFYPLFKVIAKIEAVA